MKGLELPTVFPINTETLNYLSAERSAAAVMRVLVSIRTKVETFTHPSVIDFLSCKWWMKTIQTSLTFDYWINEAED